MTNAMKTTATVAAGIVGTALIAWPLLIWNEVRKLEKPKYRVLRTLEATGVFAPAVEVRQYDPMVIAEVTFGSDTDGMRAALSGGFRAIAGFIFDSKGEGQHDDVRREKIAMTSPVTAEMGDGSYKVAFVMPSKYTADTLPKPKDGRVEIKNVGTHTLAALSFRGRSPREADVESRKQQLLALLKKHDVTPVEGGATRIYQYYPPFAPNLIRLNEVLVPVELSPPHHPS